MFVTGGVDPTQNMQNAINMYNTGQLGNVSSTSNIVEEESDPNLQQARLDNLTEQQQNLILQQNQVENQTTQQIAENEMLNEQRLLEEEALRESTQNTIEGTAKTGIQTGLELLSPEVVEANKLKNANAFSTLGKDLMSGFKAMKPVTQYAQIPNSVANASLSVPTIGGGVGGSGAFGGANLGANNLAANLGTNTVTSSGLSTIPAATTTVPVGTMAGTGFKAGLGQIGQGLGRFAKTGAGIGAISSLAGMGISRLSDDDDPTTVNFGEGAGSFLSSAGTGASIGSLLGPAGTAIGGVLGGAYGLGKSLFNRNKSRKSEENIEQDAIANQSKGVANFNEDLLSQYGTALSNIKQGELDQKSISGQDLGFNLVARDGGMRYGHGGIPPGLGAGIGRRGMNIMQQFQNPNVSRIGGGVLGNIANNFGQSVNPNATPLYGPGFRNGGMKMGMPRYGYTI